MAVAALKAGLHVMCEKPMATTVREAKRMQAAARRAGKNLMIHFNQRFEPTNTALKQQVASGVIGEVYYGRTVWHRRRGVPGFGGWFTTRAMSGGGPLIDLGVHRLDLALWWMGYPEPLAVSGATHNVIAREMAAREKKTYDVEDSACGLVKFANGASLLLEASWALNVEGEHLVTTLSGTRGGLRQQAGAERVAEIYTEENGSLFTKRLDVAQPSVPSAHQEFVASILEKREPSVTADEGIKVMKILEGIYRSAETGREVRYKAG
jgi:predicted dehydrogenase